MSDRDDIKHNLHVAGKRWEAAKAEHEAAMRGWNYAMRAAELAIFEDRRAMPYGEYLQLPYWRRVRDDALRRADHRCQVCNSRDNLNVHHRTYENRGCEHEDPADLTVLCRDCHALFHGKGNPATADGVSKTS
ncbi:MAG: HNH endonuclease [Solirubrobacteraceae bacterium]